MTRRTAGGELKTASRGRWRSLFGRSLFGQSLFGRFVVDVKEDKLAASLADPLHCDAPALRNAEIAAIYTGQRVAGDFYEFLRVGPSRMLFVLLDIAGSRADTRDVLIAVQKTFRTLAPELFGGEDFNETTAMIELCYAMNRTIMLGGVRSCPAFLGCYNEDLGTVCYANAGHTPALLRHHTEITLLEATGLPLGLFSHTTQSAAACHLLPGSALVAVSRGIIEADRIVENVDAEGLDAESSDPENQVTEFGLHGVKQSLQDTTVHSAHDLCLAVLQAARQFTLTAPTHNDLTTLALVRWAVDAAV